MNVLILDDQKSARRALSRLLEDVPDVVVMEAGTAEEARAILGANAVDIAFIDIRLSDDIRNTEGLDVVREARRLGATIPICVTASGEMSIVREAMRAGAQDYVLKDELCAEIITPLVVSMQERQRLENEVERLRIRVAQQDVPHLVGISPAMERVRASLRKVALSDRPVLVTGPTGAGKEAVVSALHAMGPSPEAPLLDLNCSAIPDALMESQLFGHERGAFTGADRRQAGYFGSVGTGTLFLDEVAELAPALQAKLLRVLETNRFRAVGSTQEQVFRGRLVSATHRDLSARVREGLFREDLYYRLAVLELRVPPLDEHPEDIPLLVQHFSRNQRRPVMLSAEALAYMQRVPWPGNVRQLRNVLDRLSVYVTEGEATAGDVEQARGERLPARESTLEGAVDAILNSSLPDKLQGMEELLVQKALAMADGNKSAAARLLGVHRKVIERRAREDGEPPGE